MHVIVTIITWLWNHTQGKGHILTLTKSTWSDALKLVDDGPWCWQASRLCAELCFHIFFEHYTFYLRKTITNARKGKIKYELKHKQLDFSCTFFHRQQAALGLYNKPVHSLTHSLSLLHKDLMCSRSCERDNWVRYSSYGGRGRQQVAIWIKAGFRKMAETVNYI